MFSNKLNKININSFVKIFFDFSFQKKNLKNTKNSPAKHLDAKQCAFPMQWLLLLRQHCLQPGVDVHLLDCGNAQALDDCANAICCPTAFAVFGLGPG